MSKKPKNNIARNVTTIRKPEPTGPIKLSDDHAAIIRAAEKHVVDVKCRLANLVVQQLQAAQDAVESEQRLVTRITELARLHGIEDVDARKWNFDTKQMTFTRTDQ